MIVLEDCSIRINPMKRVQESRSGSAGRPLDRIRQSLIGEYDLFKGSSEAYKLRTEFITAFYAYVKDGGYASMSWTEWVKTHPLRLAVLASA